jgi:phosphatidylinositol glycan class T
MVFHGGAHNWQFVCLTVLSLTLLRGSGAAHDESFSEELLVRPLLDGKVLAHFHFVSKLEKGADRHHRIFPKAVDQLVSFNERMS